MTTLQLIAVAFFALVVMALVTGSFYWVMRIRLMRMDTARDRIEWLSLRAGDDVLDTYKSLFPGSVLPRFCRFAFWAFIVFAAFILCVVMIKR